MVASMATRRHGVESIGRAATDFKIPVGDPQYRYLRNRHGQSAATGLLYLQPVHDSRLRFNRLIGGGERRDTLTDAIHEPTA